MKKLIAVTMVLVLMVSFVGCGAVDKYLDLAGGVAENMKNVLAQQDQILGMVQEQLQSQSQPSFSYEEMIDSFVPNWQNCCELEIGDIHKANGAVWLPGGMGTVYSSDESVVTVSSLGKVTAVGEGEAYVVITSGSLFQVTRYTVTAG